MRIVYVEDNQANVFLVKRVARMGGHDIINYIDGEEALSNITRDQPNLILMDIQLAGEMSGLQVVEKLREDGFEKPIIAVTAYAMVGDRERCLTAGCNDYIAKPLSIPLLIELMDYYNGKAAGSKVTQEDSKPETEVSATIAVPVAPPAPLQAVHQVNGTGVETSSAAAAPAVPPTPAPTPAPAPQPPTTLVFSAPTPAPQSQPPAPSTTPAASTPSAASTSPAQPGSSAEFVEDNEQVETVLGPAAVVSDAAESASDDKVAADTTDDSDVETKILTAIERRPEAPQSTSASPSDDQSATLPSREVSESATNS